MQKKTEDMQGKASSPLWFGRDGIGSFRVLRGKNVRFTPGIFAGQQCKSGELCYFMVISMIHSFQPQEFKANKVANLSLF